MKYSKLYRRRFVFVYAWIAVLMFFFVVLRFLPIVSTFTLSLFRWELIRPYRPFIGFENFVKLAGDANFHEAIGNTTIFALIVVAFSLVLSLMAALALEKKIFGSAVFETLYFLPYVIPLVPIALTWKWIYDPTHGLLNYLLGLVGVAKQGWLIQPHLALPSIMFMTVWQRIGYNMVIFIVGLKAIPSELFEAARMDGAGRWQGFRWITFPLLLPIVFYLMVINTIEAFQVFTQVFVMTTGTQAVPAANVRVLVMDIYQNAFRFFHIGYASAESVILFLIILIFSLIQFGLFRSRGGLS